MSNHPKLPSDLVSALPKQIMVTWGERLVMPFLQLTLLAWLPLEFVRRLSFPSMTAAIGQVVAQKGLRTTNLEDLHIPNELVDDMALATRFKTWSNCTFHRWIQHSKMSNVYFAESNMEWIQQKHVHWSKRKYSIVVVCNHFVFDMFHPSIFLMCLYPWLSEQTIIVLLGCIMVDYMIRMLIALRYGHSWLSVLSHPVASVIVIGIFLNSGLQTMNGAIEWKEEHMAVPSPIKSQDPLRILYKQTNDGRYS